MRRLIILLLIISVFGCKENGNNIRYIDQNELTNLKVDDNSFEPGGFPNNDNPLFRDFGVFNEIVPGPDVDSTSVFHPANQPQKKAISFVFDSISVDYSKKLFSIRGKMTAGYSNTKPNDFKVYIGKRIDTTVVVTYMISPNIDSYFKGKKLEQDIDFEVPAFYFDGYQNFLPTQETNSNEVILNISALINKESVLVLSHSNIYAEIFEIGKLLKKPE